MKLSIIVPVYNEAKTILEIIEKIQNVNLQAGVSKEIIIVNDGSTDGTTEKLRSLESSHPGIMILSQTPNQGKTAAVKFGIAKASGDFILIQDADMEYDPQHYPLLLEPLLRGWADVVYGSRFKGHIRGMTLINRIANEISNKTINILYGTHLTDLHTCFKVFKNHVLKRIEIVSENFTFDTEISVKLLASGYSIYEVPIDYTARKHSEGKKISWGTAVASYLFLLKYGLSTRIRKRT